MATRGDAVFDYSADAGQVWREYRPMAEVFSANSIDSLAGASVTDDHPQDFVDIYNARELNRGTVLRAWQDGALMRVRVVIRDAELIQKIRDGKVELSCGYSAVVVPGDGTHPSEGEYQATQTQIVHNHLAVVDAARAGPVARLAVPPMPAPAAPADDRRPDSAGTRNNDAMNEIIINGVTYKVDPAANTVPGPVAEAWTSLQAQLTQQATELGALKAGGTPATDPNAAANAAAAAAAAGAAAAPGDANKQGDSKPGDKPVALSKDDVNALVESKLADARKLDAARSKAIAAATKALPANYMFDGKPTAQILADAIVVLDKDYKAIAESFVRDGKADVLAAVLDVKIDAAGRTHVDHLAGVLERARANQGKTTDADQARRDRILKLQHKPAVAAAGGK